MGIVLLDMAMSLDGCIAGPSGDDDGLHDWYFAPDGTARAVIDELYQRIGAMILGRHLFDAVPDDDNTPSHVPHFVLTHTPRPPVERGGVRFTFVHDGIAAAVMQAKAAAGDKDVCVSGGADTAQQCLQAGVLDELHIHLVATLLGGGLRLFDHIAPQRVEQTRVRESPGVMHLVYRVVA